MRLAIVFRTSRGMAETLLPPESKVWPCKFEGMTYEGKTASILVFSVAALKGLTM